MTATLDVCTCACYNMVQRSAMYAKYKSAIKERALKNIT